LDTQKTIWTIGHSTLSFDEFVEMLQSFDIKTIVDVRSYPGSRRYPQFNKENLEVALPGKDIQYIHIAQLGGRRKANPDSQNTLWRHPAFRGYADYMGTDTFKEGINLLTQEAVMRRTAIMCSEAVWWRCHRSLISDYLKSIGWKVTHIMDINKEQEHPYTSAARIVDGRLTYKALL